VEDGGPLERYKSGIIHSSSRFPGTDPLPSGSISFKFYRQRFYVFMKTSLWSRSSASAFAFRKKYVLWAKQTAYIHGDTGAGSLVIGRPSASFHFHNVVVLHDRYSVSLTA